MYQNKLKAIDLKVQTLENYNKASSTKPSIGGKAAVQDDGVSSGQVIINPNDRQQAGSKLSLKKNLRTNPASQLASPSSKNVGFKRSPSKESIISINPPPEGAH
jgi:hypothetical protein